jgi:hypothetical protein
VSDLAAAIAECLALHAKAMDKLGTDHPELDPRVAPDFRDKIIRQWAKVSASLEGDPEVHRLHVEALNKGVRILLRRLAPSPAKSPSPPLPVWDDTAKAWRVPVTDSKIRIAELAEAFDRRIPDDPNDLFREGES